MHRGEPEQRVLDVVAGQDRDRPLGRKLALRAAPARCARTCAQRLRVAERAPGAVGVALGEEDAVGRGLRPMFQPLRQLVRIGLERVRRAQMDRAVGLAVEHDVAPGRAAPAAAAPSASFVLRASVQPWRHPRSTFLPRFSRKSFSRALASSLPCAIAAISDSVEIAARRIALGDARQHVHDGEIGQRRVARRCARRARCPWRGPRRGSTR